MERLAARFGKTVTVSLFIMGIGIILFFLTIPLYANYGIDTDIIGATIFALGLGILFIGIARGRTRHGWKAGLLNIMAVVLFLPAVLLLVSLIYYLVTGRDFGW